MAARPRKVELFDHITAVVLAKLYEGFPTPIDLSPIEIGAEVAEQVESEEQEAFDMGELVHDTVTFLEEQNLLSVGVRAENTGPIQPFMDVRLTAAGLAILGQEATPLAFAGTQTPQSWGARLRAALATPETLGAVVRTVLELAGK
ncbi:hypothetical protein [Stenotrophomonas sp. PD6]|uniref:hypothetical protein n=1 Tax=Stenotrophomonas sp. PD6 TaxID=3368612 RepID=UPI003BA3735D